MGRPSHVRIPAAGHWWHCTAHYHVAELLGYAMGTRMHHPAVPHAISYRHLSHRTARVHIRHSIVPHRRIIWVVRYAIWVVWAAAAVRLMLRGRIVSSTATGRMGLARRYLISVSCPAPPTSIASSPVTVAAAAAAAAITLHLHMCLCVRELLQ